MKPANIFIFLSFIILQLMPHFTIANELSTLEKDPNLVVETLPNGFTVAVYPNSEPPNRVSMRLLVRRGSAFENHDERGLAHFIEHMAFNGTKNFPSGDMVEYFQRLGMAFGADTNAHTSFSETVYKLDMPDVSDKLIDDGIMLLRDYADGILFNSDAIDKERGVIIAEMKSRDTKEYRRSVKEIGHYYKGTIYADRMPIGDEGVIKTADREKFLNFYRANYRPENMALIVVGDVNPESIIAKAGKYFSDMKACDGISGRELAFGALERPAGIFGFNSKKIDFDAEYDAVPNTTSATASIAVSKLKSGGDSYARRARNIKLAALSNAISTRYARVANDPNSKISGGNGANFTFDNHIDTMIFGAYAPVGKSKDAAAENFRQLLSLENLSDGEIANAKKKVLADIQNEIDGKSTRKNPALADEITATFSDGDIYTSPEFDMQIAKKSLDGFDAAAAKRLLLSLFENSRIKVFLSDADKAPSAAELKKIVNEAYSEALSNKYPAETFASCSLVYSEFPNKIITNLSIKKVEGLGIEQMEFKNGIAANIKTTDFSKDEILMKISFGNGLLDIPKENPEYYAASYAFICGGTKFQSIGEINAAQYSMKFSLSFGIDGNSFYIMGRSTRNDFNNMVRFAATMLSDPGFREDGMEALKKYGQAFYRDFRTNPLSKIRYASINLTESSFKDVPGTYKAFERVKMEDIRKWLEPIIAKSPMEISIVGDIESNDAWASLLPFANMPERKKISEWAPFDTVKLVPEGNELSMKYASDGEPRSIAARLWLSCGRENIKRMRIANVLGAVLDDVLRKDIREKEGKVYSPFAYNNSSTWIKNTGFMTAMSFVEPEYNKEIGTLLQKCGETTLKGITQDEFERAKIPLLKSVEANMRKNAYWLDAVMNRCQSNPLLLEMAKNIKKGYQDVTLQEVRDMAKEIFSKPPYCITVIPENRIKD